jgi:hypothetical protein
MKWSSISSTSPSVRLKPAPALAKTQRAVHIARAVHLDDAEAGVLLVVGTEAAVIGTAVLDWGSETERDRARLVELRLRGVGRGIAIDKRPDWPMVGAALAHVDLAVPQQDLGVNYPPAGRADAARQFIENLIGIDLAPRTLQHILLSTGTDHHETPRRLFMATSARWCAAPCPSTPPSSRPWLPRRPPVEYPGCTWDIRESSLPDRSASARVRSPAPTR